ncbi:glyoxalase/bleomycin resistance protein/dioxygenase superfamily protein [Cytobacillus firmus]|uniref:Glyoxalase/bleomycin resistance protein/dioxygenase superfamily protein n=2 Tax=Cytobacillus TaxID=2675230 RepID=A0A366JIN0_CYTFI|nr:glyoxalase/bleomycin resistance protein/dioxygenase superfamily protein [Cytobacillus firmus]TDX35881.1 glyoxalase/bleomycin resistance protein/dioxygenase superfamily protein [Cytobacillus oceanisediminis]
MQITSGIHHITAMVNDAQRNIDFYAGVLGLRLVKKQLTLTGRKSIIFISVMKMVILGRL